MIYGTRLIAVLSANCYMHPILSRLAELWRCPPAHRGALPLRDGPRSPLPLLDAPTGGYAGGGAQELVLKHWEEGDLWLVIY